MKRTVIVVDMNNGFCKEGALHDQGILTIVPNIIKEIETVDVKRRIFITDCHEQEAREFQDYPIHCLKGSGESEIIEELLPYVGEGMSECNIPCLVEKNSTNASWANGMSLQRLCEESEELIMTGCCTDICILQFALSIQTYINQHNLPTVLTLPESCVATFHIPEVHDATKYHDFAIQLMKNAGIRIR